MLVFLVWTLIQYGFTKSSNYLYVVIEKRRNLPLSCEIDVGCALTLTFRQLFH